MLHSGLTLDGFEDILNQELQRGEAVIHPTGSEWALLRGENSRFLKIPRPQPWLSTEGSPFRSFSFAPSLSQLKDGLA